MKQLRLGLYLLFVLVLGACGDETPSAGGDGNPEPAPTATTFSEAEWTITTPAGWTEEDITTSADAEKAIRYKAASGEFFIVAIDPTGSDFSYDALWRYRIKGSAFEVVERTTCAGTQDQSCSDKDSRYDGYLLWPSGEEPGKVGGHTWYFIFGDADSTTIDQAIFEQVAESIQVKTP